MKHDTSHRLYEEAKKLLPGGVNSPVRSFKGVGGEPPFILRGRGSRIWDADNNEYIDYVGSWGPLILGHAHPGVTLAVREMASRGTSFGAPTPGEVQLAQLIQTAFPSMQMMRLVSSGTEACMSAVRLARAFTSRSKIIKFNGCYHGHADSLLVKAGSGGATFGVPDSAGVPASFAAETLVAEYNDLASVDRLIHANAGGIAAIIVEPIAANMGVVLPQAGFLEGLRSLTAEAGALLIFDEVITGFRVAWGGAQQRYAVTPDLTCLGKIVGGGMPLAVYGGSADIMRQVAPLGAMYQAGTLSGNPVAVAAGIAMLHALQTPKVYERLEETSASLEAGLRDIFKQAGRPVTINRIGSLMTVFFRQSPVQNWSDVEKSDVPAYGKFFHGMLDRGVYLAPSAFEAMFVSLTHTPDDIEETLIATKQVAATL
ncbi:MAG: glutamate-1-semialdehyde-2,1-aminomutase [Dehalococcoidia bacterium]|nr:glutamate-1-semialdehyde-2,1-aminomutase [Dehalococcoidia bacterium]